MYTVAVDIGGTFTDVIVIEDDSGRTFAGKSLTTPADLQQGVLDGLADAASGAGLTVSRLLGAGRNQLPVAAMAAAMGGNVRVGLEDSLWLGPGKLAESNAAQVSAARRLIDGLGLSIATPAEARAMLALKGRR
jgi:uncharacterized protein (DUF849 family)